MKINRHLALVLCLSTFFCAHPLPVKVSVLRNSHTNQQIYLFYDVHFHHANFFNIYPLSEEDVSRLEALTLKTLEQVKKSCSSDAEHAVVVLVEDSPPTCHQPTNFKEFILRLCPILPRSKGIDTRCTDFGFWLTVIFKITGTILQYPMCHPRKEIIDDYKARFPKSINDFITEQQTITVHQTKDLKGMEDRLSQWHDDILKQSSMLYCILKDLFLYVTSTRCQDLRVCETNISYINTPDDLKQIFLKGVINRPSYDFDNEFELCITNAAQSLFTLYSHRNSFHKFLEEPFQQIIVGFYLLLSLVPMNAKKHSSEEIQMLWGLTLHSIMMSCNLDATALSEILGSPATPKICIFAGGLHCERIKRFLLKKDFINYFESSASTSIDQVIKKSAKTCQVNNKSLKFQPKEIEQFLFNLNETGLSVFDVLDDHNLEQLVATVC